MQPPPVRFVMLIDLFVNYEDTTFFFSSRRRHTRLQGDWSSDVCSSDLMDGVGFLSEAMELHPLAKRALLTAYADTSAAIDAINEARVHYYFMKPWDPPEEKDRKSVV